MLRKHFFADTHHMKTCVILFAGNLSAYACDKNFDGKSAFDLAIGWASRIEGAQKLCILASGAVPEVLLPSLPVEVITESSWTVQKLLSAVDSFLSRGDYATAVFSWADCPFLDDGYTKTLIELHHKYFCEYTFAEGFPYGITPEVIDSGTVRILKNMGEKSGNTKVDRDSFFSLLKTDINSFEIETYIPPFDLRQYRLSFHCGTKRNALLCGRMHSLKKTKNTAFDVLCREPELLHTLPSFYALQIAKPCCSSCSYCPYPAFLRENPLLQKQEEFMDPEKFSAVIQSISDFSDDAVISLSLWGEAMLNPHIEQFIETVLKNTKLSLVIETCSFEFTQSLLESISSIVQKCGERTNGQKSIYWIVGIDAHSNALYNSIHNDSFSLEKAVKNVEALKKYFPGSVYPQFLRLKENEDELEGFYRFWKAHEGGELIIQKYDSFAGTLEDKKVTDLSPVIRTPCWHLRNDIAVMLDGTVPLCKSILPHSGSTAEPWIMGNIFTDSMEKIWGSVYKHLENHCKNEYGEACRKCDEYYTFNF